jgi:glycerol-3-phosphate dehydrogenase
MVAMNHRLVNTVINRCKMPADGDILVPVHTVAVIGTTDEKVTDPELLRIEPWEVQLMLDEGDKLVPGLSKARVLRAWAGVRPLYQEGYSGQSRDATRALTLLDHQARDGVRGFLTITGGKWTTFRLMAETTMDMACKHLGIDRPCKTADTVVPGVEHGHYWLGHRLREVEDHHLQGSLVCECELVTRAMLEQAAVKNPTVTLDDLRRDVRLGMGPCQGGFCTYRAAGILHELQLAAGASPTSAQAGARSGGGEDRREKEVIPAEPNGLRSPAPAWDVAHLQSPSHNQRLDGAPATGRPPAASPALLLRDFLQERWRGLVPILWGQQLKQERLDELIYLSVMNADHLPDAGDTSPLSEFWQFDTTPSAEGASRDAAKPKGVQA